MSDMNKEFVDARIGGWLSWLGHPMAYDGGLCVNRSIEEHREHDKYKYKFLLELWKRTTTQEPLGYEFEKVLFDNLWDLYEE